MLLFKDFNGRRDVLLVIWFISGELFTTEFLEALSVSKGGAKQF